MVRRVQKRIVWKNDPAAARQEVKSLRQMIRAIPRHDGLVFEQGNLYRLTAPMEPLPNPPREQAPEFPYLTKSWFTHSAPPIPGYLPQGSLAIFLGNTRVEELDGTRVRSILRPTFFINDRRFMTFDLNDFEPVP